MEKLRLPWRTKSKDKHAHCELCDGVCVCVCSMEGDEFSAGEEEGDFDEGGGGQEEMVEFVNNGVCVCRCM